MSRLRIVTVAPYVPHARMPHAGGAYLYRYLTAMSAHADVTLIAPAAQYRQGSPPARLNVHEVAVPPDAESMLRRRLGNLRNFRVGLTPGWHALRAFDRDPHVRSLVANADVVDIQWGHMLPLLGQWRGFALPPVVALDHDVVSQSFERRAKTARFVERRILTNLARRIARQEADWLNRCELVRVFSSKDRALLERNGVTIPVLVIDPDLDEPSAVPPAGRTGPVAFVGALWRPENVDGVLWFAREVWPLVLGRALDARLVVTGADPPAALSALGDEPSIEIRGFVPDLSDAYASAGVFVVPLRMGAGLKFKVPQAMLFNLPVVTTPVGAEGIVEEIGTRAFGAVTDDPNAFAAAVIRMLTDHQEAATIAEAGRHWAVERFSFSRSTDQQLEAFERVVSARRKAMS